MAGLTRSQSLFSLYTGVDACALAINSSEEFYLFMDLRAEQRWVSYNMNSRKWLTATNEFNCRLEALDASKTCRTHPKTSSGTHGTAWQCGNEDRDADCVQRL
jgi:hypothetical protein